MSEGSRYLYIPLPPSPSLGDTTIKSKYHVGLLFHSHKNKSFCHEIISGKSLKSGSICITIQSSILLHHIPTFSGREEGCLCFLWRENNSTGQLERGPLWSMYHSTVTTSMLYNKLAAVFYQTLVAPPKIQWEKVSLFLPFSERKGFIRIL